MDNKDMVKSAARILAAILISQVKRVVGNDTLGVVSNELAAIGRGELDKRLDEWLSDKKGKIEQAEKKAMACFRSECQKHDYDESFIQWMVQLPIDRLSEIEKEIDKLPTQLNDDGLEKAILSAVDKTWNLDKDKEELAVAIYMRCLRKSLATVDDLKSDVIVKSILRQEDKLDEISGGVDRINRRLDSALIVQLPPDISDMVQINIVSASTLGEYSSNMDFVFHEYMKNIPEREYRPNRLNKLVAEFLEEYYQWKLYTRMNEFYPIALFECPEEQQRDVESVLSNFKPEAVDEFLINDKAYIDELAAKNKSLENNPTYIMDKFCLCDFSLSVKLGTYFDALTSCDAIEREFYKAIDDREQFLIRKDKIESRLPMRHQYHKYVKYPIFNGSGRSAAIAISTLTVYYDGSTFRALLLLRSKRTATHSKLVHVVPSGMFQPATDLINIEPSVKDNIIREYLEEVFSIDEIEGNDHREFDAVNVERMNYLNRLIEKGDAELLLTGYTMNMLNLRPEICTLLLIKNDEWLDQEFIPNWEYDQEKPLRVEKLGYGIPIDIMRDDDEIIRDLSLLSETFVPPGAAAFWMGVDLARKKITGIRD